MVKDSSGEFVWWLCGRRDGSGRDLKFYYNNFSYYYLRRQIYNSIALHLYCLTYLKYKGERMIKVKDKSHWKNIHSNYHE